MQAELSGGGSPVDIRILGVNGIGLESGNPGVVAGRTIPWLQDVAAQDVWTDWKVTYRDVIVLDTENRVAGVYNLTYHDLAVPANYHALKSLLLEVAADSVTVTSSGVPRDP